MIGAISTALSGLSAASKRVEASANNIANASSAGSLDPAGPNKPYEALATTLTAVETGGVTATNLPKQPGFVSAFSPDSPFANAQGFVGTPNVDLAEEAVNLKLAEISYKANLATMRAAQDMAEEAGRLLDEKA